MIRVRSLLAELSAWKIFAITILLGILPIILSFIFQVPIIIQKFSYYLILTFILAWIWSVYNVFWEILKDKNILQKKIINIITFIMIVGLIVYAGIWKSNILMILLNIGYIFLTIALSKVFAKLENNCAANSIGVGKFFLLIWLFPVGIWVLQPKIQRFLIEFK